MDIDRSLFVRCLLDTVAIARNASYRWSELELMLATSKSPNFCCPYCWASNSQIHCLKRKMNENGLKKLKKKIRPTKKISYWSIARKKTVIYCQIWQMISNKSNWTSALIHSSIWIVNQLIWFVIFDMSQSIFITYRTKCWKMYFKIEKLIGGNLLSKPRSANSRQLRSVFTSIFKFDGAPFRDRIDAGNRKQKKMNQLGRE